MCARDAADMESWIAAFRKVVFLTGENEPMEAAETTLEELNPISPNSALSESRFHGPLMMVLRNPTFYIRFKAFMKRDAEWNVFLSWVQCERFRVCTSHQCQESHQRKRQPQCTSQDLWTFARSIVDCTFPAIQQQIFLDTDYIAHIKTTIHNTLQHRRISLAMTENSLQSASQDTDQQQYPPHELFQPLQQASLQRLAKVPFYFIL